MKKFLLFALCLTMGFGVAQGATIIVAESFETGPGTGYSVVPDFCNTATATSDYCSLYTTGTAHDLSTGLGSIDGDQFVAGEDMNGSGGCLPTDAIYTVTLDAATVTGYTDLKVTLALNGNDYLCYDALALGLTNQDYLQIYRNMDGGGDVLIGQFTGMGPASNTKLALDTDLDGWGDVEIADYANLVDYSFNVGTTGNSLVVKVVWRFESGNEEIVFDNLRLHDGPFGDPDPPELSSAQAMSGTQVDVYFNEFVDETTAETVTNYSIDNGIGTPSAAVLDGVNGALVHLTVSLLTPYTDYILTVNNVEDLNSNVIAPNSTVGFSYIIELGDVIITEFMPNPDAVYDNVGEWFEIYNATTGLAPINLNGWIIKDNYGSDTIEGDHWLNSGDYFVFCVNETLATNGGVPADFQYKLNVYPSDWGLALGNSGDELVLVDAAGQIQDSVVYTSSWVYAAGGSAQLMPEYYDATANDNSGSWCVALKTWPGSAGDAGTPGFLTDCEEPCIWIEYQSAVCLYFADAGEAFGVDICWCCPYGTDPTFYAYFVVYPGCDGPYAECSDPECEPYLGPVYGLDPASQSVVADPYYCDTYPGVGYWTTHVWTEGEGCICLFFDYQLPVELIAEPVLQVGDRQLTLDFTVSDEHDVTKYEIIRDGVKIAELDVGNGLYTYVDQNLVNGRRYEYSIVAVELGQREVLAFDGNSVWAATPSLAAAVVTEYALHQNYPNPFNPSTEIVYDVLDLTHVTLKIYNVMGQEVTTLVNRELNTGRYTVTFDASGLTSGIYFYTVTMGDFTATRKMLLIQ
ncbi:lamin tail domain-containing protein [bacterium]|nr:lamin tail domain-containing protein [bacterium]